MRSDKLEKIDVKGNGRLTVQLTFVDIDSLDYAFDQMNTTLNYIKDGGDAGRISDIIDEFDTFINQQEKCLESFKSIRDHKDIEKIKKISNFCVLMFGSIARLEYVPRKSEVNIFPLVRKKSLEQESKMEHQKCQDACSDLENIIKSNFQELEEKDIKVYTHRVEFGKDNFCFDEQDLINIETKNKLLLPDDERASLFSEAVYLSGDSDLAKEIRQKVLENYSCVIDFQEGNFPMLTYIYEQEVVAQGLANSLGEIRHKIEKNYKSSEDDWNQAKLIFSRFIGIKVKQLALHMLYWIRQRDDKFEYFKKENNIKHLDKILHQPPIYLGICYLKRLGQQLNNEGQFGQPPFDEWLETRLKKTEYEHETQTLNNIFKNILKKVEFPKRK